MIGGKLRRGDSIDLLWLLCAADWSCVAYPFLKYKFACGRVSSGTSPKHGADAKRSAVRAGGVRGGAGAVSSNGHACHSSFCFLPFLRLLLVSSAVSAAATSSSMAAVPSGGPANSMWMWTASVGRVAVGFAKLVSHARTAQTRQKTIATRAGEHNDNKGRFVLGLVLDYLYCMDVK